MVVRLLLVSLFLVGCGSSGPDASGAADAAPPDAAESRSCRQECTTVADCQIGSASNNWECRNGGCVYLGCVDTAECNRLYGQGFVCSRASGQTIDTCIQACGTPADCAAWTRIYDADNFNCTAGLCEYIGCTSDSQCVQERNENYVCRAAPGDAHASCYAPCQTVQDCVIAVRGTGTLYDTDNFTCVNGLCNFTGCNDSSECVDSWGAGYLCQ